MACGPFIKKISETQELKGEQREDMAEIFGTFGPSCASREVLEEMFRAGMTGIRLNLSHCDLADSADMIRAYHASANAAGVRARLVIDAQGPELRVGTLARPRFAWKTAPRFSGRRRYPGSRPGAGGIGTRRPDPAG